MNLESQKESHPSGQRKGVSGSFVELSRGWVRYELLGPPGGAVLVLVPGLSVPYETWDRIVSALTQAGLRVLRYEHYGRGFSDRPRMVYSLEVFVEQLRELVGALGIEGPVSLMGLSMGGAVASAAAVRYPGLVERLVLVDPLFEWPKPQGLSRLLTLPLVGDLIMAVDGPRILARGQGSDYHLAEAYEAFLPLYKRPFAYPGIARSVLSTLRTIPSWPLTGLYEALGRMAEPSVLLVWGQEDRTLPYSQSQDLLGLVPKARFVGIPESGHVPQWERPQEVSQAVLDFLRS